MGDGGAGAGAGVLSMMGGVRSRGRACDARC